MEPRQQYVHAMPIEFRNILQIQLARIHQHIFTCSIVFFISLLPCHTPWIHRFTNTIYSNKPTQWHILQTWKCVRVHTRLSVCVCVCASSIVKGPMSGTARIQCFIIYIFTPWFEYESIIGAWICNHHLACLGPTHLTLIQCHRIYIYI